MKFRFELAFAVLMGVAGFIMGGPIGAGLFFLVFLALALVYLAIDVARRKIFGGNKDK